MAVFSSDPRAFSDEDEYVAREIVSTLMRREYLGAGVMQSPDEEWITVTRAPDPDLGELPVADLEDDLAEFAAEADFVDRYGDGVLPGVRLRGEEMIPIALRTLPGLERLKVDDLSGRHASLDGRLAEGVLDAIGQVQSQGGDLMRVDQARESVEAHATRFLATRRSGLRRMRGGGPPVQTSLLTVRNRTGGPVIPTPGCAFSVTTNSPGLRVFWSGAYRVSSNYFSSPTSPATSVLQAGTYVFGVDGGAYGNQVHWDLSAVTSLPGAPTVHLNY